jgi:hypothetical protein
MAEEDVVNNSNVELANRIIDNNLHLSTKKQYSNKVKHVCTWFKDHHPELCIPPDHNELELNLIATTREGADALKEFYAHISKKRNKDGTYKDPVVHQSFEHVSGYKSAIKNHFKSRRVVFNDDSVLLQSDFFGGYKRLIADEKQDGTRKIREGKVPLSFTVYRYLAKLAMMYNRDFYCAIFAHVFLLFCWNLVARCVSVASLMYIHISWKEDAMVVVFPKTKSDQEGKSCSPKHVFANTKHPEICPILSFAIFVFTSGIRRNGASPIVFSDNISNTEDRFSNWLKTICSVTENLNMLTQLGVDVLEVGTHSFRKGVAEFLSGMVGGASPISIYLRAGWSLGPVQSRYILEGQGGDQLCGRAASGLDITTNEFASLPPHFNTQNGLNVLSLEEWDDILPGYTTFYPAQFRPAVRNLLASIIYHKEWLVSNLHVSHPLFNTRLWTSGVIDRLSPLVLTGTGRNSVSMLTATGIPPHILLANEIAKVDQKIDDMKVALMSKLEALPDELKNTMLENFQINGVVPITHNQVVAMMSELQQTLLNAIQQQSQSAQQQQQAAGEASDTSGGMLGGGGFRQWTWKGRFHPVPQDFNFPTDNMSNLWHLWWNGRPIDRIAPYRKLEPYDLDNKNIRNRFIKARRVMDFIILHSGTSAANISVSSSVQKVQYLQDAYTNIFTIWYGELSESRLDRRTLSTMSYLTFYELMKGEGKRKKYGGGTAVDEEDDNNDNQIENNGV